MPVSSQAQWVCKSLSARPPARPAGQPAHPPRLPACQPASPPWVDGRGRELPSPNPVGIHTATQSPVNPPRHHPITSPQPSQPSSLPPPPLPPQGIRRDGYGRLVVGDVIVGINGKPVRNEGELFDILDQSKVGGLAGWWVGGRAGNGWVVTWAGGGVDG